MAKYETVYVNLSDEKTHPPKDGSWTSVVFFSGGFRVTKVQFDQTTKRWYNDKNHSVNLQSASWEREVVPQLPVFVEPLLPSDESTPAHHAFVQASLPFLGYVDWKVQEDRYANKVSLIHMGEWMEPTTGQQREPNLHYRMVHHVSKAPAVSLVTIYWGKGRFIKVRVYHSDNDCEAHTCTISNATTKWSTSWGDGENLGCSDNFTEEQAAEVRKLTECDEAFIMYVLWKFASTEGFWETKEVKQQVKVASEQEA
jgi:hypothetical protein